MGDKNIKDSPISDKSPVDAPPIEIQAPLPISITTHAPTKKKKKSSKKASKNKKSSNRTKVSRIHRYRTKVLLMLLPLKSRLHSQPWIQPMRPPRRKRSRQRRTSKARNHRNWTKIARNHRRRVAKR